MRIPSQLLPASLERRIAQSAFLERRSARRLAATSKRIDICAAQFAHFLHLSRHSPLEDKTCLEVGAGWVLSHALICHLLGARRVIATDLVPHAHPEVLIHSIKHAIASVPRDMLAPFSDHSRLRQRLLDLQAIDEFTFDALRRIGVEYVSPVDLARQKIEAEVDFIYSLSVLEHVPCEDVPALLANLVDMLTDNGTMIHAIHLEDHRDFSAHPFEFLSMPSANYGRGQQSARGNRIRLSEWTQLFGAIGQTTTEPIYVYQRRDRPLPSRVDPSVTYMGEDDLRVSHVGMYTRKGTVAQQALTKTAHAGRQAVSASRRP